MNGKKSRRESSNRLRMFSFARLIPALLATCLAGHATAREAAGQVRWPGEWVVFAPLNRNHPVVDPSFLRSIPRTMKIAAANQLPELTLSPRRVQVKPGEPVDLASILGDSQVGTAAYVFLALDAPAAQAMTLGMGADWWLQAWLNGEEIFDTLERGNEKAPVGILNYQVRANLEQGENILAVRFIRGAGSAVLALGDETHFPAEEARLAARQADRALNTLPATLAERMVFPPDTQAFATASMAIDLSLPPGGLAGGALAGLRAMPERQVYLNVTSARRGEIRDTLERRFAEPVKLLLSKSAYPWEDRHLDAIVWTSPPAGATLAGRLEILLRGANGVVLARQEISEMSPGGWFFSLGFPAGLAGDAGTLEAIWRDGDREIGRSSAGFQVLAPSGIATSGRVPLRVINEPGATINGAPMTVGVPFPRGALADADRVRLVDETGAEVPVQAKVTARWSRFGPVKWLLCDFTADLAGGPREFFLEFGPGVQRAPVAPMSVSTPAAGLPRLDAGRLRVSAAGIEFSPAGDGSFQPVLAPRALAGAFVRHENDRLFTMPADTGWEIEETGSEKTVLRAAGWYGAEGGGENFCNFVTRLVFHRNSPVARIFHTWIFTGNGNRDRIREMGWRFDASRALEPEGYLASFETGAWLAGDHLVQHDYQHYNLAGGGESREGRTPGVLAAAAGAGRVLFGAKDFWQNFPSELELSAGGFTFYNWPRHNPPATFERPVTRATAFLHRFAHEGEVLDFRLPDEYADGEIWQQACSRELHWAQGRPETANAQGIARTEEMFLYFTDRSVSREQAALVMRGLNDESLRAVADPAWLAASGTFGNIHQKDVGKYPEDEHIYEQVVRAPARWNERLGFYGKWLYGDVPAWSIDLESKTVDLYRAIRKNHHGWPVGWLPYARSGDPQLLKFAEAITRQMTDANFCHYATEEVEQSVKPGYYRSQGWWDRSLLPWAARLGPFSRNYTVDCDYIWHGYYLTGYARARDVVLLFGELTKKNHVAPQGPRTTSSMLPSYLDMYQATWDPWFLLAAHEIARLHLHLYPQETQIDKLTHESPGHFWRPADEAFHRFTGSEEYRLLALNHSIGYTSPRSYGFGGLWSRLSLPYITQAAYAWELTGDPFYLARAAAYLDWAKTGVYDGDREYLRGSIAQGGTARGIFTGYYIKQFPLALGAFERAGLRPDPVPTPSFVNGGRVAENDPNLFHFRLPEVVFRKAAGQAVSLSLTAQATDERQPYYYQVSGPGGGEVVSGTWLLNFRPFTADIPAGAPAGDYQLVIGGRVPLAGEAADHARIMRRHGAVLLPAAEPEVPEVMVFNRGTAGTQVASMAPEKQYWFMVPAGTESFWVECPRGDGFRASVWNPDGNRVWDYSAAGDTAMRVTIPVPAGQAGKLWRLTGAAFLVDPRIPPYFSLSRAKWFNPGE